MAVERVLNHLATNPKTLPVLQQGRIALSYVKVQDRVKQNLDMAMESTGLMDFK